MTAEPPTEATDAYTVNMKRLMQAMNCCHTTILRGVKEGHLPAGRTRKGTASKWWTLAAANKFLRLKGRENRIEIA